MCAAQYYDPLSSIFCVLGKQLSNRNHSYSRSSVLALRVETLIKQYEELKKFRDRVRRAEAREIYARTRPSRIPRILRARSRLRAAHIFVTSVEALGLSFREIVHSDLTGNSEVAKHRQFSEDRMDTHKNAPLTPKGREAMEPC